MAPASPLFIFGRQQDFAYQQEVDGSPGKRHHIRFWRCPPGWVLPGRAVCGRMAGTMHEITARAESHATASPPDRREPGFNSGGSGLATAAGFRASSGAGRVVVGAAHADCHQET